MAMLQVNRSADASEYVETSFWRHGAVVNERFQARWREIMPADKPPPNMEHFLEFMARDLGIKRGTMVETAQAHENELSDDRQARETRDEANETLFATYNEMLEVIVAIYGPTEATTRGFGAGAERHSSRLVRQVGTALQNLGQLPREEPIPPPEGKEKMALTPGAIIDTLETPYKALESALAGVRDEVRESQETQLAKEVAYGEHVTTFSTHAKCGEMIYRMVGLEKEAAQIKPSSRRPGQREATEDEPPPAGDDAGGGEAPAPAPVAPAPAPLP